MHSAQHLTYAWKPVWNSHFVMLSSMACDLTMITTVHVNLCPFNLIFILWSTVTFERRVLFCFAWYYKPLHTESQLCCGCYSTDGNKFCLIIKFLVEMHQRVLHDGPRMLRTWLIVCCPRGWSDALSSYFHQPNLMIDTWMFKTLPKPKYDYFWNANIIQGLWSHLGIITKGFYFF